MQIDLKPFNYLETALFVPDYSCEEKAICYGITGGVAKYISMFDSDKSLDDNIADLYFNPSGFMYEEPRNLLVQEFRMQLCMMMLFQQLPMELIKSLR